MFQVSDAGEVALPVETTVIKAPPPPPRETNKKRLITNSTKSKRRNNDRSSVKRVLDVGVEPPPPGQISRFTTANYDARIFNFNGLATANKR